MDKKKLLIYGGVGLAVVAVIYIVLQKQANAGGAPSQFYGVGPNLSSGGSSWSPATAGVDTAGSAAGSGNTTGNASIFQSRPSPAPTNPDGGPGRPGPTPADSGYGPLLDNVLTGNGSHYQTRPPFPIPGPGGGPAGPSAASEKATAAEVFYSPNAKTFHAPVEKPRTLAHV